MTNRSEPTSRVSIVVPLGYRAYMSDELSELLDDAVPRCPRCLVLLDVEGEALPYLECPTCGDVWLWHE